MGIVDGFMACVPLASFMGIVDVWGLVWQAYDESSSTRESESQIHSQKRRLLQMEDSDIRRF